MSYILAKFFVLSLYQSNLIEPNRTFTTFAPFFTSDFRLLPLKHWSFNGASNFATPSRIGATLFRPTSIPNSGSAVSDGRIHPHCLQQSSHGVSCITDKRGHRSRRRRRRAEEHLETKTHSEHRDCDFYCPNRLLSWIQTVTSTSLPLETPNLQFRPPLSLLRHVIG